MTRPNSVEIGGRDSRTTSSIACRNDEPARSALAISVIVSGNCLLKAFSRPLMRRLSQKPRDAEADERADQQDERIAERPDSRIEKMSIPTGTPTTEPIQMQRNSRRLELEVGSGDVACEVGAEVAAARRPC